MTRLLIVARELAPAYAELLSAVLGKALGEKPALLSLHGGTHSAGLKSKMDVHRPQVVHFSSLDCLEEGTLSAAAGAVVADAADLYAVCQRGQLYECDRTYCRDSRVYDMAKCFAYRLGPVDEGVTGGRLFKKCLPEGRSERDSFIKICKRNSAEEFEFRFEESENVALIAKKRLDAARLLAAADLILCSNPVVLQSLKDFGVDEKRLYLDETFVPLEGAGPERDETLKSRAATLARGYESLVGRERLAKLRVERENGILLMQDLFEKRLEWESRPSHLELTTNNRCNLRCLMCSPEGRPDGAELTPDETRAICEQVFPKASLLTPSAGSEPLLGDFELITELCKKYDVQLNVITNGVLLKPEKYEMMRGILGRLQVSFDSHEKETYEEIRVGSKFETVVENIRETCKLAAEDHVEVMTSSVIITLNWMKMAEYVEFVADLGVDTVALQQLLINFPALEKWDVSKTVPADDLSREIDRAVETARRRKINLHVGLGRPAVHLFNEKKFRTFKLNYLAEPVIQRYPKVCYHMAIYAKIDPDGSVYPCCRAPKELLMGNVKQQPFDAIWNGKEYRQLRKEFLTDKLRKCCRTCPLLGLYAEGVTVERPENM